MSINRFSFLPLRMYYACRTLSIILLKRFYRQILCKITSYQESTWRRLMILLCTVTMGGSNRTGVIGVNCFRVPILILGAEGLPACIPPGIAKRARGMSGFDQTFLCKLFSICVGVYFFTRSLVGTARKFQCTHVYRVHTTVYLQNAL